MNVLILRICVFFVSVIMVCGSKTASIVFNSILFDWKLNLVGAFKRSTFSIVCKIAGKNNIKIKEKWEFSFLRNSKTINDCTTVDARNIYLTFILAFVIHHKIF